MIWEPFVLALFLGLIVSAGLYFAYLWPSVEPVEDAAGEPIAAPGHSPAEPAADAVAEAAAVDATDAGAVADATDAAAARSDAGAGS